MYQFDTSSRAVGLLLERTGERVTRRNAVLELAILGLLHESPMHGYELRKRLNALLGTLRAFSYGSLYPCLKELLAKGWIVEEPPIGAGAASPIGGPLTGRRGKIVYAITAEGKDRFSELISEAGPSEWEDDSFGVRFAFFGRTDAAVRLRILEGRRRRLEDRRERFRASLTRTRERLDAYTLELQRHGLESVEREVRWLNELIATERRGEERGPSGSPSATSATRDSERRMDTQVGDTSDAAGATVRDRGEEQEQA
jgi:DNA-binding PadR family transcriptional regulator